MNPTERKLANLRSVLDLAQRCLAAGNLDGVQANARYAVTLCKELAPAPTRAPVVQCRAHDSGGTRCERFAHHTEGHAAPRALNAFEVAHGLALTPFAVPASELVPADHEDPPPEPDPELDPDPIPF